jgi:hypothetical protein
MIKYSNYRWSLASIGVTIGIGLTTLAAIQHLYQTGNWHPQSALASEIYGLGGFGVLLSFALAVTAILKERPPALGIFALCASISSFVLYVR